MSRINAGLTLGLLSLDSVDMEVRQRKFWNILSIVFYYFNTSSQGGLNE